MDVRRRDEDHGKEKEKNSAWVLWRKKVGINRDLFERGLVAVKPRNLRGPNGLQSESITKNGFPIGAATPSVDGNIKENDKFDMARRSRTLAFFQKKNKSYVSASNTDSDNNGESIDSPRSHKAAQDKFLSMTKLSKKPLELLSKLLKYSALDFVNVPGGGDFFVYNLERRDEVFLPLAIDQEKNGLYIYPWLSSKTNAKTDFSGFEQYVTCGCLFGTTLHGQDKKGYKIGLIKHFIEFHKGQKIDQIVFNPEDGSAYEEMLFSEFNKLVTFMGNFTAPGKQKQLLYHLPYYDYMLFGVELFIRGRMSFPAFKDFCEAILQKKKVYEEKIHAICKHHEIEVTITSPFENLFGPLPEEESNIARFVLNKLGLLADKENPKEINPDAFDEKTQKDKEKKLVQDCLALLMSNQLNEKHQQVWRDFTNIAEINEVNTLEDLFKVANAVIHGVASSGRADLKTCAILPVSEKQIQISVDLFISKKSKIEDEIAKLKNEITKRKKEIVNLDNKITKYSEPINPNDVNYESKKNKSIQAIDDARSKINNENMEISRCEESMNEKLKELSKFAGSKEYGGIFNATTLESLLIYDSTTNGLSFYADECPEAIYGALHEAKLLTLASKNVTLFPQRTKEAMPSKLEDALDNATLQREGLSHSSRRV